MAFSDKLVDQMTYPPLNTLKPVDRNLWVVDGPLIRFMGLPFPTRMTIIRLADGSVWVHSPTGDDQELFESVAALGPVRALVAPNWLHYAWVPKWQSAFPDAKTWVAPGVAKRAESKGVRLPVDAELAGKDPWSPEVLTRTVEGSSLHREAVFFHGATKTLIVTDLIANFEPEKTPRWLGPLLRLAGMVDPDGRAPLEVRLSFRFGDLGVARETISEFLEWAPDRVILAHGRWYDRDGTAELRRAFRWLNLDQP